VEAAQGFRGALAADPNHAGAHQGLSHALRLQGKFGEAVPHARRAARLTECENADVLVSLADAYADARRWPEAAAALEKAIAVADPATAERLAGRLAELKARARDTGR
jgi:tetratricopeptide (TPR) repeat protein